MTFQTKRRRVLKSSAKIALVLFVGFFVFQIKNISATNALLSNQDVSSGNSFTAGTWGGVMLAPLPTRTLMISEPETTPEPFILATEEGPSIENVEDVGDESATVQILAEPIKEEVISEEKDVEIVEEPSSLVL